MRLGELVYNLHSRLTLKGVYFEKKNRLESEKSPAWQKQVIKKVSTATLVAWVVTRKATLESQQLFW